MRLLSSGSVTSVQSSVNLRLLEALLGAVEVEPVLVVLEGAILDDSCSVSEPGSTVAVLLAFFLLPPFLEGEALAESLCLLESSGGSVMRTSI